jgi:hypothetical protein
MPFSIGRIVLAVVIAVIVGIVLVGLLGPVLISVKVPIAETVGRFFVNWGFALGLLAGLWFYFSGRMFGGIS